MTSRFSKLLFVNFIAGLMMLVGKSAAMAENDSRVPGPVLELPTVAEQCIRPADFMRRNHMQLLMHKRDQTMRKGIRTTDASLQGCVDCHSKKDDAGVAIPVNAPGQFCSTCHEYTAVKLDCFECHRTTPDTPQSVTDIPADHLLFADKATDQQNLRLFLQRVQ